MWFKQYRDYPIDRPLIKETVEPGHGIIGCEMHDLNGWGTNLHQLKSHKKGIWRMMISYLFKEKSHEPF